jgi:ABC-type transporter Mla subunit MlaD
MPDGTASNRRNIGIGVGVAAIVVLLVVAWLVGIFGPTTPEPETTAPDTQEPQQE